MAGERTSVYLTADLAASVKASGTPLAELIRRGLTAGTTATAGEIPVSPASGSTPLASLRRVVLCHACAAALQSRVHQRDRLPGAARIIGGTAA